MSQPSEIVLDSPAKINWILRILGRRGDGFHEIETVFQTISLRDRIVCEPAGNLELTCDDPSIPVDSSNLVMRAIEALDRMAGDIPRFRIHIEKAIPSGGGLGGGSSNAAAVLRAFRDRFAPEISEEHLRSIALELGSDVPFFLSGGTAYARGRGEQLMPLPALAGIRLLVVIPTERVPTAEAYAALGRGPLEEDSHLGSERIAKIMENGPLESPQELVNDFEEVIFERLPNLRSLREQLLAKGAVWARMAGSGSTIVGAFRDEGTRQRAARSLRDARVVPAETTG